MTLVPPVGRSFMDPATRYSQGALQARSAMRPNMTIDPPGKTAGGAISAGAGMGMAGYMMGSMGGGAAAGTAAAAAGSGAAAGGITGPQGALIGAGIGLAAYLLS